MNSIPNVLAERSLFRLALIQFDIARPFHKSLRGNKYFLLIIDNWTRKNWVIPLPSKSEATQELRTWKVMVKKEVDEKIKAARSDNAPELLLTIEGWRQKDGDLSQPRLHHFTKKDRQSVIFGRPRMT
jgi:hypothetical protein